MDEDGPKKKDTQSSAALALEELRMKTKRQGILDSVPGLPILELPTPGTEGMMDEVREVTYTAPVWDSS